MLRKYTYMKLIRRWDTRMWPGSDEIMIFLPHLTLLQNSEVWTTRFLFQPICRLPGKFVWDSFSSLGEIAGEGRAPHTGSRVGTNSPAFLLGMAWPILCCIYHPVQNLSGQDKIALLFWKIFSFGRHFGCRVGRSTPKVSFLLAKLTPYTGLQI